MIARRCLALVFAVLTIAAAWSCATDAGIEGTGGKGGADAGQDSSSGGVGNTTSGDGSWPIGKFGAACNFNEQCESKLCVDVGQSTPNFICTTPCVEGQNCPSSGHCAFHPEHGYLCVPDKGSQCKPCITSADCATVSDRCTPSPNIDRFCARDCSFDGQCPAGTTCVLVSGYPGGSLGGGDPGDASVGEGGASKPPRFCVPTNDESCPCGPDRDGVKRKCSQTSGGLTCEGTETCSGGSGQWQGCTAGAPSPEICDGVDNDCNGTADDGTAQALCSHLGNPVNATWACNQGQCEIDSCSAGYVNYPPTLPPSAGCPCKLDAAEPNETCATATDLGFITDANTNAITMKGTLSSAADVDWYTFEARDHNEGTTNSYHVRLQFTIPANNSEFQFDVVRSDTCKVPDAKHSSLTSYNWCVDGNGGLLNGKPLGQSVCGPTAAAHCGPHTKRYYVRVKRTQGAPGTCAEYTLTATAKGGGTCDFTQACDPQVSENL
ncbi:MAG: hypothetical protein KF718_08470 [Polyangiaceae bacterium]|nr:hypothetical protein [Polyangiaceae bacterium]